MKRTVLSATIVSFGFALGVSAQSASQPRRVLFDTFVPIAARIQPGDQRIVVESANPAPDAAEVDATTFVETIVRENPVIFTGRVVDKQPVFMRRLAGQPFTQVSPTDANWIGSRLTVMVERIIHTVDEFPLTILQRLTFIDDGDGTATIRGVRIDTETPWLESTQQGKRYLISARLRGGAFFPTGMWKEPADAGNTQPRALCRPKTPFEDWPLDEVSDRLEAEVQRVIHHASGKDESKSRIK